MPGKSKRDDFPIIPSKCALLIIDIQSFLSEPSNDDERQTYFYREALPRAIESIEQLVTTMRSLRDSDYQQGCEVIFTYLEALTHDCRDISLDYKLSGPMLSNLPNAATSPATFLSQLTPSLQGRGDIKIPKTSCSVFASTNIHYVLRNLGIEQLIITGQLTDQCIESAVRDAADLGFFVTVVDDACAAKSPESHDRGLHGMKGFSRIVNTSTIQKELSHRYTVEDLGI
jgi:ureidoacrylate peracid hydrolase